MIYLSGLGAYWNECGTSKCSFWAKQYSLSCTKPYHAQAVNTTTAPLWCRSCQKLLVVCKKNLVPWAHYTSFHFSNFKSSDSYFAQENIGMPIWWCVSLCVQWNIWILLTTWDLNSNLFSLHLTLSDKPSQYSKFIAICCWLRKFISAWLSMAGKLPSRSRQYASASSHLRLSETHR